MNVDGWVTADFKAALSAEPSAATIKDMIGVHIVTVGRAQVAIVTLARPAQHNALNLAGWQRIAMVFTELSHNPGVRVVILRGAGNRAFGAGADISEFPSKRIGTEAGHKYNRCISAALEAVQSIPVPVISMIDGFAVGGGFELAAACDMRIASNRSRFGIPIGKLGVILGLTETRAVVGVIGAANLKYLVYSGELVDAQHALASGFVQEVVEHDAIIDRTSQIVHNIVMSSEVTIRATKQVTALAEDPAATNEHELIEKLHNETYDGLDLREGVDAFLTGRVPEFFSERSVENGRT